MPPPVRLPIRNSAAPPSVAAVRPPAPHLRIALAPAQAKLAATGGARAPLAAHVQAALAATSPRASVQAKLSTPPGRLPAPSPAPHVRAAITRGAAGAPAIQAEAKRMARGVGMLQCKPAKPPLAARPSRAIQRSSTLEEVEERRSSRASTKSFESYKPALAKVWKALMSAGEQDAELKLASDTQFGCAAVGYAGDPLQSFAGAFSGQLHGEMDVLNKLTAGGFEVETELARINIETEPCPRCGVVLNGLGIGGKVRYKNAGKKKAYPTWEFPARLQADAYKILHLEDAELPNTAEAIAAAIHYLTTQEWWR